MRSFSAKHQLMACTAPLLLVAVALLQLSLAHTQLLSPWKGGGFGMFSTVDSPGARFLRLRLLTEVGILPVQTPAVLRDDVDRLRTMPSEPAMLAFGRQLATGTWYVEQPAAGGAPERAEATPQRAAQIAMLKPGERLPAGARVLPVRQVQVELWRYRFDTAKPGLVAEPVYQLTLDTAQ